MSEKRIRAKAHEHECAVCGRRSSCSKPHAILDGGRIGLHPRCAQDAAPILPERPLRISLQPPRRFPPVEPVTGAVAILARALGQHGGPCALDVLGRAYRLEHGAYHWGQIARFQDERKRLAKDARDLVARLYEKELKKRGEGKWRAAAVAAMNKGREIGLLPFDEPGTVKTYLSRLHAREKRAEV